MAEADQELASELAAVAGALGTLVATLHLAGAIDGIAFARVLRVGRTPSERVNRMQDEIAELIHVAIEAAQASDGQRIRLVDGSDTYGREGSP